MAERDVDATASRKVELAIGELDSLSVPPCVAVQYLSKILQGRFSPTSVLNTVECEPALAAKLLSLAQRVGAGPARQRHALRLILDRLDADQVRDTLLGTKVTAGFEIEFAEAQPAVPARKDLILHSLAVACCARRLAETAPLQVDPELAYSAGLLHDIGKLALQDIMPKSLAAIVQQAKATKASLHAIEQEHLGTNHALLGRQLAQRWRLPDAISLAIWLHHSDSATLMGSIPDATAGPIVWAANHIARQIGLGDSGSFGGPEPLEHIAETLGVAPEALRQIQGELPEQIKRKSEALGLDMPNATARYCDLIQASAAELSRKQTELSLQSRDLQTTCGYLEFTREFLQNVDASLGAIDIAEDFARRWQRFFQTGTVCLYLPAAAHGGTVDAVVVEALGHSTKTALAVPDDTPPVPQPIANKFAVVGAGDHVDWLLEQAEADLDPDRTKLLPLMSNGRPVAVVAFEMNYPGDASFFAERFERAASMAGAILDLALARQRLERFSQRLVQLEIRPEDRKPPSTGVPAPESRQPAASVEALAEMAAGVAHELNNPLSVISGRAQLLAKAETDKEKKRTLKQIQDNAREASGVVDDLMSFAEPAAPRATKTAVGQILDEAMELAGQKTGAEHINAQIRVAEDVGEVLVDSAQIVSAIANIISNSIESYTDTMGPIKITAEPGDNAVTLQISDLGHGMDSDTVRKATHPFFSAKPAGRKRGMGLAYAARLIQLNGGALAITSQPTEGTTITITLPADG